MKKTGTQPRIIHSITELHQFLGLPKPEHPLLSIIKLDDLQEACMNITGSYVYDFYSVCIKKDFNGRLKYGQTFYDFDAGIMTCFAPGQVISTSTYSISLNGWWLAVHPDFFRGYELGKRISNYGYFSYAVNEALHVSEKEEAMIIATMQNIAQEYRSAIDLYSQDVLISQIELLLTYCNRFYNRQFITRKLAGNDLLTKFETVLTDYFSANKVQHNGLPTVQYIAKQLAVSANYLSDLLRSTTGQSAQQHIHNKLIERAKESLSTTSLSVSEIAYLLGFEHPQSFSKLFRNKTQLSPLEFRQAFN